MTEKNIPCRFLTKDQGGYTVTEIVSELHARGLKITPQAIRTQVGQVEIENKYLGYRQSADNQAAFVYSDEVFEAMLAKYAPKLNRPQSAAPVRQEESAVAAQLTAEAILKLGAIMENLSEKINALGGRIDSLDRSVSLLESEIRGGDYGNRLDRVANILSDHTNRSIDNLRQAVNSMGQQFAEYKRAALNK